MPRPRKPATADQPPAVAKVCACGSRFTTRSGERFCRWCAGRIRVAMARKGYLTPVDD